MPNKIIVTMAAVRGAIEAIEARGGSVSVRAVREEIGGGSMTSIAARLRQWRAPIAEELPAAVHSSLWPEAFEEALRSAGAALWNIANEDACARITAVQEMSEASIESMRAEREALALEVQDANGKLAAAQSMVEGLISAATQSAFRAASERLVITQDHLKEISDLNDQLEVKIAACLQHERNEHAREIERLKASHAEELKQLQRTKCEEADALRQEIRKLTIGAREESARKKRAQT